MHCSHRQVSGLIATASAFSLHCCGAPQSTTSRNFSISRLQAPDNEFDFQVSTRPAYKNFLLRALVARSHSTSALPCFTRPLPPISSLIRSSNLFERLNLRRQTGSPQVRVPHSRACLVDSGATRSQFKSDLNGAEWSGGLAVHSIAC